MRSTPVDLRVLVLVALLLLTLCVSSCGGALEIAPLQPQALYLPVRGIYVEDVFIEQTPLKFAATVLWPYIHEPDWLEVAAHVLRIDTGLHNETIIRMQFSCPPF